MPLKGYPIAGTIFVGLPYPTRRVPSFLWDFYCTRTHDPVTSTRDFFPADHTCTPQNITLDYSYRTERDRC